MKPLAVLAAVFVGQAVLLATPPYAGADESDSLHTLVDTAAQRLQTADPVAAFKWTRGGDIEDPARVAAVLDAVGADARARGLDDDVVRRVFRDQINATEAVEYSRFAQWKFTPADAPTTAPDLSESRAEIDGFNRVMVAEIAARRDVLAGPNCRRALDDARTSVAAERRLDDLYIRALDTATASYCETT